MEMLGPREMLHYLLFCCSVLVLTAEPPALTPIRTSVVTLSEHAETEQVLAEGITCKDPDNDKTRVFTQNVIPNHPCGQCFPIWPCGKEKYCLMFEPSLGKLHYSSVSLYLVQVTCTDDIDGDVSTESIEVRLTSNSPPTFTNPAKGGVSLEVKSTISKRAGDVIYDTDAKDVDKDSVFYTMTSEPATDLFEIGYGDGKIRATQDLRNLCEDTVMFRVMASDAYNAPVGPVVVQATFKRRNERPRIDNTDTIVEVPENAVTSFKVKVTDRNGDDVMYQLRAKPERGLEYYSINDKGMITSSPNVDYEYTDLRSVRLYVDVTDGFCDAEPYSVTMLITDVNEPPVISPDYIDRTVYEGTISLDPGWRLVDPDSPEDHKWRIVTGGSGHFTVDTTTGIVRSDGELDIDPEMEKKYALKMEVRDRENVKDTAILRITVLDKNDHVPVFLKNLYKVSATPCSKVGAKIGAVHAKDEDSEFQGNNALVYSGTGRNISVLSTGEITLLHPCTDGERETIEAYVTDQGTYPGPLSGVPTTISLVCHPCPEPVTTDPIMETTETPFTATKPGGGSNGYDFLTSNLSWLIPSMLLALLLVTLLAYILRRCCVRACSRWRARKALPRDKCQKVQKAKAKPSADTPKKKENAPPIKTVPVPPLPPPVPPANTEPFLFGFWKETFMDRDQRKMPKRDSIPASVEQDRKIEEKEREEEAREKEKRRLERVEKEEEYQKKLQKYNQALCSNDNSSPPQLSKLSPVVEKKRCNIS